MCGVLGIVSSSAVASDLVVGLSALQHRGQDAAGIVTWSDRFHLHKGTGRATRVFGDLDVHKELRGRIGIGHVRYATQGSAEVQDAQPVAVNYPLALAMAHNGNVTNFARLRTRLNREHHRLVETNNDVELILYTLAALLERADLKRLGVPAVLAAVSALLDQVEGAYSVVAVVAGLGLLGFRDRHGIRPLVLGERRQGQGHSVALASESTVFDHLGFAVQREVAPGEAVLVTLDGQVHHSAPAPGPSQFCAFEFIYFAREDAVMNGARVAAQRILAGRKLADRVREAGLQPDIVIDVPNSAYFAATGLAEALGLPYRRGLAQNPEFGRSFLHSTQAERERAVRQKLNPIREVIADKKVAVVDDSIVRGTTSRHIVRLLRDCGAKAVYMLSAAPPVRFPCVYGIDIATRGEILAAGLDTEQIRQALGADAVVYQRLDDLQALFGSTAGCYACFCGVYPTPIDRSTLRQIESERRHSRGDDAPTSAPTDAGAGSRAPSD